MWTNTTRIPTTRTITESHHHRQTTATTAHSHLKETAQAQKILKNNMAALRKSSSTQANLPLAPKSDITLASLQQAPTIAGLRLLIELVLTCEDL
jgi:prephenate dehydratase